MWLWQMVQEFSTACFNPSGDTVVLGSFNGFHVFRWVYSESAKKMLVCQGDFGGLNSGVN